MARSLDLIDHIVLSLLKENPATKAAAVAYATGLSLDAARKTMRLLRDLRLIPAKGRGVRKPDPIRVLKLRARKARVARLNRLLNRKRYRSPSTNGEEHVQVHTA